MNSIAILWQRFGPYHLARLRGTCGFFQQVHGIEVAGRDHYAWNPVQGEFPFHRTTLFRDRDYESLPRQELARAVHNHLDQIRPDAVAINGWSVPEAMAALGWCRKKGSVAILMSETFTPSRSRIKEWVKKRRVRKFDAAIVGGAWHHEYLTRLGFPGHKIAIGYDAVDNEFFARGADQARLAADALRRQQGLPEKYFFANTRFLPRKNIHGLLAAYAAVQTNVDGWHLVISGSGEMESPWKQLAEDLKIADRVRWCGFLQYEQLPIYYGLAACFVHPAHEEPWGLVVNEACATGLPVIVGNRVGASCELARHGENGFVIDSKSPPQLGNALVQVARATQTDRSAMGACSRRLVAALPPERFGSSLRELIGSS